MGGYQKDAEVDIRTQVFSHLCWGSIVQRREELGRGGGGIDQLGTGEGFRSQNSLLWHSKGQWWILPYSETELLLDFEHAMSILWVFFPPPSSLSQPTNM